LVLIYRLIPATFQTFLTFKIERRFVLLFYNKIPDLLENLQLIGSTSLCTTGTYQCQIKRTRYLWYR